MTTSSDRSEILLAGLDGSNPLAFLAALGTLRLAGRNALGADPLLGWRRHVGGWRPILSLAARLTPEAFVTDLTHSLQELGENPALHFADDLNVPLDRFRRVSLEAQAEATRGDREAADFAAAFGCDRLADPNSPKEALQDTALRTMSGAGHQHFLKSMRQVLETVTPDHVSKTLFNRWRYDDPVENLTLRWDPADDTRYALRWRNPSGDPARKRGGSMLGANALAIAGLPLLTTAPVGRRLRTTGFSGTGRSNTFWTWPIWEPTIPLDVVRSLLALESLQPDPPHRVEPERRDLHPRGVVDVYRSQRLTVGKYRNFSPAVAV